MSGFPLSTSYVDTTNYWTAAIVNDINATINTKRYSGETLLSTTAVTNIASVSITGISSAYSHLRIVLSNLATVSTNVTVKMTLNANTGAVYTTTFIYTGTTAVQNIRAATASVLNPVATETANTNKISGSFFIPRYTDTANYKNVDYELAQASFTGGGAVMDAIKGNVITTDTTAITSIQFAPSSGNWTAQGNIYVYGIA